MIRFVVFRKMDGTERLVPIRRLLSRPGQVTEREKRGVANFTAAHNARQHERKDLA
jgi:hypothetical protein